jgi:DHA1 family tetracycline resistance protein-like MFS transporter
LAGWIIFLIAIFLPVNNLFSIDSAIIGTFVITLPLAALFLARAIDGLTGGNVSVANAYVADISSDENRSKNFGKMAISSNLGFIVGPALAGILGATVYGETLPVLAALFLSLVTLAVISLALREPKPSAVLFDKQAQAVLDAKPQYSVLFLAFLQCKLTFDNLSGRFNVSKGHHQYIRNCSKLSISVLFN